MIPRWLALVVSVLLAMLAVVALAVLSFWLGIGPG